MKNFAASSLTLIALGVALLLSGCVIQDQTPVRRSATYQLTIVETSLDRPLDQDEVRQVRAAVADFLRSRGLLQTGDYVIRVNLTPLAPGQPVDFVVVKLTVFPSSVGLAAAYTDFSIFPYGDGFRSGVFGYGPYFGPDYDAYGFPRTGPYARPRRDHNPRDNDDRNRPGYDGRGPNDNDRNRPGHDGRGPNDDDRNRPGEKDRPGDRDRKDGPGPSGGRPNQVPPDDHRPEPADGHRAGPPPADHRPGPVDNRSHPAPPRVAPPADGPDNGRKVNDGRRPVPPSPGERQTPPPIHNRPAPERPKPIEPEQRRDRPTPAPAPRREPPSDNRVRPAPPPPPTPAPAPAPAPRRDPENSDEKKKQQN